MEIWKEVLGYEGIYEVSNFGKIKSLNYNHTKKEKLLKPNLTHSGYFKLDLCLNGKVKTKLVHQIVAEAFLNHKADGFKLVVNHINFDKKDNRVENLEITTQRENSNLKHIKSTSQYVGVHFGKNINKWISSIRIKGKSVYLGCFENEIEASNAYQNKLKELL